MSRRRLIVLPLVLFVVVSGTVFTLAKLHLARPSVAANGPVKVGDFYRGQIAFDQSCAPCHGKDGSGGGIGPKLAGANITLTAAKAQIDNGGGAMPPHVVQGAREEDVLAYLATIISPAGQ